MLMVIFGAGASYDSVHPRNIPRYIDLAPQFRPPLAYELVKVRELFGKIVARHRPCAPLVAYLRDRIDASGDSPNIERELDEERIKAEKEPHRQRQLAAFRYYLRDAISETTDRWYELASTVTNYGRLLSIIESWRLSKAETVALVTFNYDTLLERAANEVLGLTFSEMGDYIKRDDYRLFKPHGSVDWARYVENVPLNTMKPEAIPRMLIDRANDLSLGDYVSLGGNRDEYRNDRPLFPAIAIPLETKRDFECPKSHLDALDAMVKAVDRLVIVGWRATELHFLDMWPAKRRPILCANGRPRRDGIDPPSADAMVNFNRATGSPPAGGWDLTERGFTELVTANDRGTSYLGEWLL